MNHMNTIGQKISTRDFSYNKLTKQFTTCISDLQQNPLGQLYNDACDAGFVMVSASTQDVISFYLVSEIRDRENELTGWKFLITGESARQNPRLAGLSVVIFND